MGFKALALEDTGDLHPAELELLEPQSRWGITFPLDDWRPETNPYRRRHPRI